MLVSHWRASELEVDPSAPAARRGKGEELGIEELRELGARTAGTRAEHLGIPAELRPQAEVASADGHRGARRAESAKETDGEIHGGRDFAESGEARVLDVGPDDAASGEGSTRLLRVAARRVTEVDE